MTDDPTTKQEPTTVHVQPTKAWGLDLAMSQVEELREALELARRSSLESLGVAHKAIVSSELKAFASVASSDVVRLMQFNLLADGMSTDGFLVQPVMEAWPTSFNEVPTADGSSVGRDQMLREMMEAKTDPEALKMLKAQYDVPESRTNLDVVVDWSARNKQVQLLVLAAGRPDVLVFQECDHFGGLASALAQQGYCSQLPGKTAAYSPAHLQGHDSREPEALARFQRYFQEVGHSFLPNLGSNAMRLQLQRQGLVPELQRAAVELGLGDRFADGGKGRLPKDAIVGLPEGSEPLLRQAGLENLATIDDDGIAIFWRADRFVAESLRMHHLASGKGIALEVRLRSRSEDRQLVVLGSHLSSGGKPVDEEKRLKEVDAPDGLLSVLRACMGADRGMPVVLSLDANSHPQLRAPDGESSVWRCLRSAAGASVWDAYFDDAGDSRAEDGVGPNLPVSTNKVRGPCSDQVRKIGGHAYHLIDHVFFNPDALSMRRHVLQPTQFDSPGEALLHMLPSLENPSDHYPVIVDLAWT